MSSYCAACGAEVIWALTEQGERIALAAWPVKRFVFLYGPPRALTHEVDTYVAHAPVCSQAGKYPVQR